ncbi:MT-A70-domain-containing protein [Annulohypoxylon maeteangense]|uniref:MT-A70-domain-containing protein n=1 Tax=Annulohypoxylon maeteangense TaxID=1927788 RepID=UPI0020076C9B|nr:MT-A70-domain-containing protein [Annulohypoxylon maeteangense]KAI0888947.1 MT-A70-domain-containing protein [Annulohypoxylon maeteangense]
MSSEAHTQQQTASCILFENSDKSVVLIDIPRSIEEAQQLPGEVIKRHIISSNPIEAPWNTPEPKKALHHSASASAAIAELMTLESVKAALQDIKHCYKGPWCLPRVLRHANNINHDGLNSNKSHKRKQVCDSEEIDVIPEPHIPDQSKYLLGSIESQRETFLADAPMFDLIVLDPPWPSRSVKRKQNSYKIANDMRETKNLLTKIPVASHLKPDGLVAIWVTNKTAVSDLLLSPSGIFSEWGIEFIGEWIWVKITNSGDPVVDIEAQWKKPWERLLLGRKRGSTQQAPISTKVILGVPDVHSRKPNLKPLFQSMMPENYSGLEVFARNLTANWWSWGDEVLHFQQRHHWVEMVADE